VIDKRDHPTAKSIFQLATLLMNSRGSTTVAAGGKPGTGPLSGQGNKDPKRGGLFGRLLGSK
jgi:hypothetical protein